MRLRTTFTIILTFIVGLEIGSYSHILSIEPLFSTQDLQIEPISQWAGHNPFLPRQLILCKNGYTIGYDGKNKSPSWTYEKLTIENIQGNEARASFFEDEDVPEPIRSLLSDYKGSGYDRGHMAPAGDFISSADDLKSTFSLSNMCPQHPTCNRGIWRSLEEHVRELVLLYPIVHVVSGTSYIPKTTENGSRVVCYPVIGNNDVGVPTHLWKIIYCEQETGEYVQFVYLIPNDETVKGKSIEEYRSTIEKVERSSGLILKS